MRRAVAGDEDEGDEGRGNWHKGIQLDNHSLQSHPNVHSNVRTSCLYTNCKYNNISKAFNENNLIADRKIGNILLINFLIGLSVHLDSSTTLPYKNPGSR